jgi:hypothetical protein
MIVLSYLMLGFLPVWGAIYVYRYPIGSADGANTLSFKSGNCSLNRVCLGKGHHDHFENSPHPRLMQIAARRGGGAVGV